MNLLVGESFAWITNGLFGLRASLSRKLIPTLIDEINLYVNNGINKTENTVQYENTVFIK